MSKLFPYEAQDCPDARDVTLMDICILISPHSANESEMGAFLTHFEQHT